MMTGDIVKLPPAAFVMTIPLDGDDSESAGASDRIEPRRFIFIVIVEPVRLSGEAFLLIVTWMPCHVVPRLTV